MTAALVFEWTNSEETRRLLIERLPSGLFSYREEHLVTVDETSEGGGIYDYWHGQESAEGLYPSALDAQNDAALRLGWFHRLLQA